MQKAHIARSLPCRTPSHTRRRSCLVALLLTGVWIRVSNAVQEQIRRSCARKRGVEVRCTEHGTPPRKHGRCSFSPGCSRSAHCWRCSRGGCGGTPTRVPEHVSQRAACFSPDRSRRAPEKFAEGAQYAELWNRTALAQAESIQSPQSGGKHDAPRAWSIRARLQQQQGRVRVRT